MREHSITNTGNPIVFCVDTNYLKFLLPLVDKITHLSTSDFKFYIITPLNTDITSVESRLNSIAPNRINFLEFDVAKFDNVLNRANHITISTYLRLFIPHILPEHVEFSLYLDVDLLILESLDLLFNLKPREVFSVVQARGSLSHHPLLIDINPVFYGGVMLINHVKWKEKHITERCLEIARSHGPFENQDNDLLHLVLDAENTWGVIESKYNVMYYENKTFQSRNSRPAIVHFPGTDKPWNSFAGGLYAARWRKHYSKFEPSFKLRRSLILTYLLQKIKGALYKKIFLPLIRAKGRRSLWRILT